MAELGEAHSRFSGHSSKDVPACNRAGPEKTGRKFRTLMPSTGASTSTSLAWLKLCSGTCREFHQQGQAGEGGSRAVRDTTLRSIKSKSPAKYRGNFFLQPWTREHRCAVSCSLGREWCFLLSIGPSLPLAQKHTWKKAKINNCPLQLE